MPDRRVTFKMLDKEKRRRVTTCAVYFAILLLGILIGLIPYLLNYVKESKADREVLRDFINKNVTNYLVQIAKLEDKVARLAIEQNATVLALKTTKKIGHNEENKPSSLAMTSKTTKTILHKRAFLIGNGSITLVCKGKITVDKVKLNDVETYESDVAKFNNFCQSNKTTEKDTNSCKVSIKDVLGYPLGTSEYTEIEYKCKETF